MAGTGEAHCPGGMFVIRAVVTMLRADDLPVSCGRASPFADAEPFPDPWRTAADAGSGLSLVSPRFFPDDRPAPDLIVALAAEEAAAGRTLTVLTLGPVTNLADALDQDPTLPGKVRVVSMLGAIGVPGNVQGQDGLSSAEWNAHADPTAVRKVLEAGFDWTLIPLDATQSTPLTAELYTALAADHAAGPANLVFELWSKNAWMYQGGSYLWDPLAAIAVRDAGTVTTRPARLRVLEGAALNGGSLVEDGNGRPVTVATSADRARFEAALLERLRLGGARANAFSPVATIAVQGDGRRCVVHSNPAPPPAGQLQIDVTNAGTEPLNAVVFELGGVTWPVVESYARTYDPAASPPPVSVIAQVAVAPTGGATAFGVSPAGSLGVACFTGSNSDPTIVLAGPFAIGR